MLIRFFRSSYIIQYALLAIIAAALWAGAFIQPQNMPEGVEYVTPLYNLLADLLHEFPRIMVSLAFVLILLEAFILNSILIYHDMVPKNSLLPSFIFILLMSSAPGLLNLYPVLVIMPLMIFFLHTVFKMYELSDNTNTVLSAGLLLSVSSMFYGQASLLLIFFWIIFLIFRILSWREWLISIISFIVPYLYLLAAYLWFEDMDKVYLAYGSFYSDILVSVYRTAIFQYIIWGIIILLIILPSFFTVLSSLGTYNINLRKKMSVTAWLVVFAGILVFTRGRIEFNSLFFLPATILVSHFLSNLKKTAWHDVVIMILLVLIIIHNFISL